MTRAEERYSALVAAVAAALGGPPHVSEQDGRTHGWPARTWHGPGGGSLVLVNNSTDTHWWHELGQHCAGLCLVRGRLAWLDNRTPTQGQVVFYFGADMERFEAAFADIGATI